MRLLADMALFVTVANMRHFGRAAATLDMPASTLSRRIKELEKELGVALIHRSTRSFALTDAGVAFHEQSSRLMDEAAGIRDELKGNAAQPSGHIRIGAPLDLSHTIFLPMAAEFVRGHPGISVEILTIQGHPNLLAEGLDLAFFVGHQVSLPDSSQWSRRIGVFSRKLFASKQYLKRRAAPRRPAELADHDCILYSAGAQQRRWELRRGRERCEIDVRGTSAADSVGLLAQFAKEHLGIAILPDFLAQFPSFGGGLTRVLPEWEAVPAHIFAVTPTQRLPNQVRAMVDYAKAEFSVRLAALEGR